MKTIWAEFAHTRNTQHATRNTQHATRNTQHDFSDFLNRVKYLTNIPLIFFHTRGQALYESFPPVYHAGYGSPNRIQIWGVDPKDLAIYYRIVLVRRMSFGHFWIIGEIVMNKQPQGRALRLF
jgi:hypothetical protein